MKLNHIPPYCPCSCHAGEKIFEYLDCCPYIGEMWAAEWNEQKKQELVPTLEMSRWLVYRVTNKDGSKDDHFVGQVEGVGRVSSKIVNYDKETQTGVTSTGRQYALHGGPCFNFDAASVWGRWCHSYKVDEYEEVSDDYSNPEMDEG